MKRWNEKEMEQRGVHMKGKDGYGEGSDIAMRN
jgi:hypothetical protein